MKCVWLLQEVLELLMQHGAEICRAPASGCNSPQWVTCVQSQSSPAGSETWGEIGSSCPCQGICLLNTKVTPPLQSLELISLSATPV